MIDESEIESVLTGIDGKFDRTTLVSLLDKAEKSMEQGYAINAKESLLFVLKKSTDIDFHEGIVRALTGLGKASLVLSIFEEALDYLAQAETSVVRHFPSSTFHGDILSH